MKRELVRLLAAVGLVFYVLPVVMYLFLAQTGESTSSFSSDTVIALLSLFVAALAGVYGAWTDRLTLIWGAGIVFAVIWFVDGSLFWVVPGLLFLSAAIVATARA